MRHLPAICGLLVGLVTYSTLAQHQTSRVDETSLVVLDATEGIVKGMVRDSDEEPGPWTIILEGNETKVVNTDNGHFHIRVPPGIYTARVQKTSSDEVDKRAQYSQFLVKGGDITEIEVDPTYEDVYCSKAGEKVIPVFASHGERENLKGLRKPEYDSFSKRFDDVTIRVVVQHCGKTMTGRFINYKSPAIGMNTFTLAAQSARFDNQTRKFDAWNVYAAQHGKTSESPYASASLWGDGIFINLAADSVSSLKGEGAINSGHATFDFKINSSGVDKFEYEDHERGIKLTNGKSGCLVVVSEYRGRLTLWGSAVLVNKDRNTPRARIVHYTVGIQDNSNEEEFADQFSINIPGLKNYEKSGEVTSGDIEVRGSFRSNQGRVGQRSGRRPEGIPVGMAKP